MKEFSIKLFINENKYKIIGIILLAIPIFFGLNERYIFSFEFFFSTISVGKISFAIFMFLFLSFIFIAGTYLIFFIFDLFYSKEISVIEKHPIVKIYAERDKFANIKLKNILSFILSMIFEEILFRQYTLGFLLNFWGFKLSNSPKSLLFLNYFIPIILSSVIFSIYHIHIYFSTKSIQLMGLFMLGSFSLGIILGAVFIYTDIFFTIILHGLSVYIFYVLIAKHYLAKNDQKSKMQIRN